jgi:hypothetical protein
MALTRIADLRKPHENLPQGSVEGTVLAAPASSTDYVYVQIDKQPGPRKGPYPWVSNGRLPRAGDGCLLIAGATETWALIWGSAVASSDAGTVGLVHLDDYAPHGDGTTSDHVALRAAYADLPTTGGVIELGSRDYYWDVVAAGGPFAVSKTVVFRGQGADESFLTAGPQSAGSVQSSFINITGTAKITVDRVTVRGQSVSHLASGQYFDGIKHSGTAPGAIILRDAHVGPFRYPVFAPGYLTGDGSTVALTNQNPSIISWYSEIEGLGGSAGFPSTGVLHQAASGTVSIVGGSIHHCGLTGDVHSHGVYVGRGCNTRILNVDFDYHWGGRYVQIEDQISDLTAAGTAPKINLIDGCTFGPNWTGGGTHEPAVMTSSWAAVPTQVRNCYFALPYKQIQVRASAQITGNTFKGGGSGTYYAIVADDTVTVAGQVDVLDNWFQGNHLYDISIEAPSGVASNWNIAGNKFLSATTDAHIHVAANATGAVVRVKNGNLFSGTSTAGTNDVWARAGALVEVDGNDFYGAAANHTGPRWGDASAATSPTIMIVRHNYLNTDGAGTVASRAPGTLISDGNVGPKA